MEVFLKKVIVTNTKKGQKMMLGTMVAGDRELEFLSFEPECLDMMLEVQENNTIDILRSNEYQGKTVFKQVRLIKEGKKGLSEEEQEELFNELVAMIPDSFKALFDLWQENKEAIKKSPAAIRHHHNYVGGLLQHLKELKAAADALAPQFGEKLDMGLVYAGIALHDFGKIWVYTINKGIIGIDEDWQKKNIGHVHWGFAWAINQQQFKLAHMVASHHGFTDWGALTEPDSPEAHFLFIADMLSSRLGKVDVLDLEE